MVEVNLEEDPEYPVAADYDEEELETLTAHDAHGTHVSLEDWEKSALQRQYTHPTGSGCWWTKSRRTGLRLAVAGPGASCEM